MHKRSGVWTDIYSLLRLYPKLGKNILKINIVVTYNLVFAPGFCSQNRVPGTQFPNLKVLLSKSKQCEVVMVANLINIYMCMHRKVPLAKYLLCNISLLNQTGPSPEYAGYGPQSTGRKPLKRGDRFLSPSISSATKNTGDFSL
jgi:hypothetical protein